MLRFEIIDCFGDPLRRFASMKLAKIFKRNKPDCKVREIAISELIEECLF